MLTEKKSTTIPEIWGGIECSFNRVRSKYFDQLAFTNHYGRSVQDIELFAELGITTMRYPVIWECLQPRMTGSLNWNSTQIALEALRKNNVTPIAGLVHHGSGPRYADITSPGFARGLASFAAQVARKFPWLEYYTPVNEPLTTARFCGLYGLWFPHKRNDKSFVRILLNEMKAVVLAMREIRKINPTAKLVQTEDLAKVYSTPFMNYQAVFENHRRWLTFDILCGRLVPGHPLWKYFVKYAQSETDLYFFIDNPCPPDIIGLDYYPTSERFLDEHLERYPCEKHGHNHRHRYADVEAIRVRHKEPAGIAVLLDEVWKRYQLPMSITEVHINCDYENQVRWFFQIRENCIALKAQGVNILGVTSWAMLGSYGWNRLLTQAGGDYESGAFDVSAGYPLRTPVGDYLAALSTDPEFVPACCLEPGWWQEESRFLFERNSPAELVERDNPILNEDCVER
jgi:dTDP-4-dehydrorhamnose reductase